MTPNELQRARSALKMTQQELATALGVARNTVARWEMGSWGIPTTTTLAVKSLVKELAQTAQSVHPAP